MRRLPASLLVLTPLALALLYAGAHALLAPRPDLATVVPRMAVLTARFRGVEALDLHWPFDRPPDARVSETLPAARNVAGLPGVDRSGPIHFVLLPREARADPSLVILPVSDAGALRDRFEGRDAPADDPRGLQRHAQHLEIRGDFAALAWDREAVRHLGEGGITCEDRGEDFALAADVPALVAFVLSNAGQPPWRALVEALGAEPAKVETKFDETTGARAMEFPAGRVPLLAEGWRTARLWAWKQRREVQIELEPADEELRALLRDAVNSPSGPNLAAAPRDALAWGLTFGQDGRRAVARALQLAGVAGVEGLFAPERTGVPNPPRMLRAWALANVGDGHSWTWVLEAIGGAVPSLAPALPTLPAVGSVGELPAGAAPVTVSNTRGAGVSPAGKVRRLAAAGLASGEALDGYTVERLVVGTDADRVASVMESRTEWRPPLAWPDDEGMRILAYVGLAAQRAHDLISPLLTSGGLLSVLAGGDIEGDLCTDGSILRLRLRAAAR